MSDSVARLLLPGISAAIVLFLTACAGPQHGSTAQGSGANQSKATTASLTSGPGALALGATAPDDLVGLDGPALERLLGEPGLVRRDYPAEVWQYRSATCVLDVYFYPDHDRLAVAHAEARAPSAGGISIHPSRSPVPA